MSAHPFDADRTSGHALASCALVSLARIRSASTRRSLRRSASLRSRSRRSSSFMARLLGERQNIAGGPVPLFNTAQVGQVASSRVPRTRPRPSSIPLPNTACGNRGPVSVHLRTSTSATSSSIQSRVLSPLAPDVRPGRSIPTTLDELTAVNEARAPAPPRQRRTPRVSSTPSPRASSRSATEPPRSPSWPRRPRSPALRACIFRPAIHPASRRETRFWRRRWPRSSASIR
jgi:hypothetical protein